MGEGVWVSGDERGGGGAGLLADTKPAGRGHELLERDGIQVRYGLGECGARMDEKIQTHAARGGAGYGFGRIADEGTRNKTSCSFDAQAKLDLIQGAAPADNSMIVRAEEFGGLAVYNATGGRIDPSWQSNVENSAEAAGTRNFVLGL